MIRGSGLLALALSLAVTAISDIDLARTDEIPRIGVLDPSESAALAEGFRDGLRQAGYSEGNNFTVEWRRCSETEEELQSVVSDLMRSRVSLIVTMGSPATRAALQNTSLPVVFLVGNPVATGFASSLAKPGGNGTGVSVVTTELEVKRLELLHQLVPKARRVGVLTSLSNPLASHNMARVQAAARTLGIQLEAIDASSPRDLDVALRALQREPPEALLVPPVAFYMAHGAAIAQALRKSRIPTIYGVDPISWTRNP